MSTYVLSDIHGEYGKFMKMLEKLQEDIPSFRGVPVRPDRACTGEHDVMELLRKIRNLYEPVRLIELHEGR